MHSSSSSSSRSSALTPFCSVPRDVSPPRAAPRYEIPHDLSENRQGTRLSAVIPVTQGRPRQGTHFYLPLWDATSEPPKFIQEANVRFKEASDADENSADLLGEAFYGMKFSTSDRAKATLKETFSGIKSPEFESKEPPPKQHTHLSLPSIFKKSPRELKEQLRQATFYFQALPHRSALMFALRHVWNDQPHQHRALIWRWLPYVLTKQPAPLNVHDYAPHESLPLMAPDSLAAEQHTLARLMAAEPFTTQQQQETLQGLRAAAPNLTPEQQQTALALAQFTEAQQQAALNALQLTPVTPKQLETVLTMVSLSPRKLLVEILDAANVSEEQQNTAVDAARLMARQQKDLLSPDTHATRLAADQKLDALHAARLNPEQQLAVLNRLLTRLTPAQRQAAELNAVQLSRAQQQAILSTVQLTPAQQQVALDTIHLNPEQQQILLTTTPLTPYQLQEILETANVPEEQQDAAIDAARLTAQQVRGMRNPTRNPLLLAPEQQRAALNAAQLTPQQQQAALNTALASLPPEQRQAALNSVHLTLEQQLEALNMALAQPTPGQRLAVLAAAQLTPEQQQAVLTETEAHATPAQQQALQDAAYKLEHHSVHTPLGVSGNTLLHQAMAVPLFDPNPQATLHLARRLVQDYGADVNQVNYQGETSLHLAVERQSPQVVAFLLAQGAHPHVTPQAGQTVQQRAQARNHPEISRLMTQAQEIAESQVARQLAKIRSEDGQWGYQGSAEHPVKLPDSYQGDYFHIRASDQKSRFWLTYHHAGEARQYGFVFQRPEQALWAMDRVRELLDLPEWQSRDGQQSSIFEVNPARMKNYPDQRLANTTLAFLKSWNHNHQPNPLPEDFRDITATLDDQAAPRPMDFQHITERLIQGLDLKHPDSPFHEDNTPVINIILNWPGGQDDVPVELTLTTAENAARPGQAQVLYANKLDACKAVRRLQLEDYRFQVPDNRLKNEINDWIERKRERGESQENSSAFTTGLAPDAPKPGRLEWPGNRSGQDNPEETIEYRLANNERTPFNFPDKRTETEKAANNPPASRHQGDAALYMADQAHQHPQAFLHPDLEMDENFKRKMSEEEGFSPVADRQLSVKPEARERMEWTHHHARLLRSSPHKLADLKSVEDIERIMAPFAHAIEHWHKPEGLTDFWGMTWETLKRFLVNLTQVAMWERSLHVTVSRRPWLEESDENHPLRDRPARIQLVGTAKENGRTVFLFNENELEEKVPDGSEHHYQSHFVQSPPVKTKDLKRYTAERLLQIMLLDDGSTGVRPNAHKDQNPRPVSLATRPKRPVFY